MRLGFFKVVLLFFCIYFLFIKFSIAASLIGININNGINESIVTLRFNSDPIYHIFYLHNPERVVLDVMQHIKINMDVFPISFGDEYLIRCIRSSTFVHKFHLRLVFDMVYFFNVNEISSRYVNTKYNDVILVFKKHSTFFVDSFHICNDLFVYCKRLFCVINGKGKYIVDNSVLILKKLLVFVSRKCNIQDFEPIIIAIDAGHGGQDPGAVGFDGLCEKDVTIAIAYKLKKYLSTDKLFKPVLVRNSDCFISVMDRSEIARRERANFLVSIHTDASLNKKISGASIWILSNRRANSEINNLLERRDKTSELLGGIFKLFINNEFGPYFNKIILDLQFNHSQRVGYDCGVQILNYLDNIIKLHKIQPEFSSFGILCSPDIPSLLIEIGFISNLFEEKMLSTSFYQKKIAEAIYKGIRSYFTSCHACSLTS